ncbi:MAG: hypothetical protein NTV34_11535 [Proteobacteria bacterium]|nr:hypothetical protein [Pseudomonadota bacterium]
MAEQILVAYFYTVDVGSDFFAVAGVYIDVVYGKYSQRAVFTSCGKIRGFS